LSVFATVSHAKPLQCN